MMPIDNFPFHANTDVDELQPDSSQVERQKSLDELFREAARDGSLYEQLIHNERNNHNGCCKKEAFKEKDLAKIESSTKKLNDIWGEITTEMYKNSSNPATDTTTDPTNVDSAFEGAK